MKKRFVIHVSSDHSIDHLGPSWTVLVNPSYSEFLPGKIAQFDNCEVVMVQFSRNDRNRLLSLARELLAVASEVKIVKADSAESVNEQVLIDAPAVPYGLLDMTDTEFKSLAGNENLEFIHPAQDYNNGVMSYGAIIKGQDKLVTSAQEIFPLAVAHDKGYSLLQNQLSISHLRQETVLEFFSGGMVTQPDVVFNDIRVYIHRYIYFTDPETYDLVTVWIMGTYIFRVFRYYPYLHLNAEKGSGKTLLMELMAPVSFNGVLLAQPAASTVIKLIDKNSATLFIDEAEGLSSGNHQILKTGFARSGIFYAGEKMYRTYSPKCFAGINGIDDVLADRAITIKMIRKTDAEAMELYQENAEMRQRQMSMRDSLYLFGLQFGPAIAKNYEADTPFHVGVEQLSNRAYDVWAPLYRIASSMASIDLKAQVYGSLDKLSQRDNARRKMRDAEENETGVLLQGLIDVLREMQPLQAADGVDYYDPDVLYAAMIKEEKIPKSVKRKGFSQLMNRILEIHSVPKAFKGGTKRMYAVDIVKFEEYKKRYADVVESK